MAQLMAQKPTYTPQKSLHFDHLVGVGEQGCWHCKIECLRAF